jgi:hypothetical protein
MNLGFTPSKATKKRTSRRLVNAALPKWVRITSMLVSLMVAGSVVVGTPLHPSDRGCNMPAKTSDCGHEGITPSAPGIVSVPLCCVLDCQEPAPTGTAFIVQPPLPGTAFPQPFVLPLLSQIGLLQRSRSQSPSFKPPDTYLRKLALLI